MFRKNAILLFSMLVVACSGGHDTQSSVGTDTTPICNGSCATPTSNLTINDVQMVLAQGIAEATARGANATIAVVDRVGNVLAVYRMGAAASRPVLITTNAATPVTAGLEGIRLPDTGATTANLDHAAAIAKALTGAYLSSEGNAFSTRTAGQIIQDHFNVGEAYQAAGPLFGVQFSQLACSDLTIASSGATTTVGPQRSPLGLSADPGGFPLYKNGTVVGGVGVMADGVYGIDKDITNIDDDLDEAIAYAATYGFAAPVDRRADHITAAGKTLRFSDITFDKLRSNPASAPAFGTISNSIGTLIAVNGYADGNLHAGTVFGQAASGIRTDGGLNFPQQDAFVLVDSTNSLRFAPQGGTDGASLGLAVLSLSDVKSLINSALTVASQARAQIRQPIGSTARVTIAVVDTTGAVLGIASTRDVPLFGIDVSLQKARSAMLLSSDSAAAYLSSLPPARYINTGGSAAAATQSVSIGDYVTANQTFLGNSNALADGSIAYSARAFGNLSRPFYPDGIDGNPPGPFSKPAGQWSVFSTGMQLDVSINAFLQHVLYVAGAPVPDVAKGCAGVSLNDTLTTITGPVANLRLANGFQIFPGGVPIYRGNTLVGAIGVSGDGVDQDDMVAFLAVNNAGSNLNNAPAKLRADTLTPKGVRLRYVQCPQSPFINSNEQNVCEGK
jgi:uncharacterized protein GlcG (DUF336 family)